jgi:hypothetical protein
MPDILTIILAVIAAVLFVSTVYVGAAILTAPYICERCGRLLDGPLCPDCDRELIAELERAP